MGNAVRASNNGLNFDFVWDRYHAKGRLRKKSISVVSPASLKERMNGVRSRVFRVSSITQHYHIKQIHQNSKSQYHQPLHYYQK